MMTDDKTSALTYGCCKCSNKACALTYGCCKCSNKACELSYGCCKCSNKACALTYGCCKCSTKTCALTYGCCKCSNKAGFAHSGTAFQQDSLLELQGSQYPQGIAGCCGGSEVKGGGVWGGGLGSTLYKKWRDTP